MDGIFNPKILVEKLAKLNNSQQSIETLSHWCIFHMNKAKQVVETWEREFHSSPREQRLAFLYLANDILQNSRRKGADYVGEFWRVLPEALRDVIRNGDDTERNAALRMIDIWDDRKVFGSRGRLLKEEFAGRHSDSSTKNVRQLSVKLRQPAVNTVDKILSDYEVLYGGQLNEDAVLSRCRNSINCVQKLEEDFVGDSGSAESNGVVEELQGQHDILRECIQHLTTIEASKASLVSHLNEALHEQEIKLEEVRTQIRAARLRLEKTESICQQSLNSGDGQLPDDQTLQAPHSATVPRGFLQAERDQAPCAIYARQVSFPEKTVDEQRKSAAAAVAAQLTASTTSAEMLTYVLTSLAQEGVIGNTVEVSPVNYPPEKRPKLNNDQFYVPEPSQQLPLPPFPHPDGLKHAATSGNERPPPPPSSPPPLAPQPPMLPYPMSQFMHSAHPLSGVSFTYGVSQPQASYSPVGPPMPSVPSYAPSSVFQGSETGFYGQPSLAPISRQ